MKIKNLKLYTGCLIVVDMVNGFIKEGALHDENIEKIVPRIIELIDDAKKEGKLIVFIKDTHTEKSTELKRFGGVVHCGKDTLESKVIDRLEEYTKGDGVVNIRKNSTSFMESPGFRLLMLFQRRLKNFDIVGCCSDICVFNGAMGLANYLDQRNREHEIYVHEDAIATYAEEARQEYVDSAKLLMEQQGIQLVKKKAA